MDSEDKIIVAFLFKRSGKKELGVSELYLSLSMDLQWFSPNDAKAFVNKALQQKLLNKKEGLVAPNFDYENVVIPAGFHPSKQPTIERKEVEEKRDVVKIIIERIVEKTDLDEGSIAEKINNVEQQKHISIEVATALVGKEFDVYLDDCFKEIEKTLEKV
jgi:hypothetical protein